MPMKGGRGLTIDTAPEGAPAENGDARSPAQQPRSGGSTPKRQAAAGAPAAPGTTPPVNRSWLQSPRKWAGRTPKSGDGTPNSQRLAAYYATLQKPSEEAMFGKDEEDATHKHTGGVASGSAPVVTATVEAKPTTPLSSIMHQSDRSGRQQTAQPLTPTQQAQARAQAQLAQVGANPGDKSLWGRFVGCFNQTEGDEGGAATTSAAPATTAQGKTETTPPKLVKKPTSTRRRVGLLGEMAAEDVGRKCLVLDLDETLVHSSFQPVENADFIIPIKIDDTMHKIYVIKRPGVDEFMYRAGQQYEVVIFTASLSLYADPLLDQLDIHKVIRHRLFRESCTYYQGNYVKDLTKIDRDISDLILVDNSPLSYMFQPENAIGCSTFIDDPEDRELDVIGNFLSDIKEVDDVRDYCKDWRTWGKRASGSPKRSQPRAA